MEHDVTLLWRGRTRLSYNGRLSLIIKKNTCRNFQYGKRSVVVTVKSDHAAGRCHVWLVLEVMQSYSHNQGIMYLCDAVSNAGCFRFPGHTIHRSRSRNTHPFAIRSIHRNLWKVNRCPACHSLPCPAVCVSSPPTRSQAEERHEVSTTRGA